MTLLGRIEGASLITVNTCSLFQGLLQALYFGLVLLCTGLMLRVQLMVLLYTLLQFL